jgi:cobalt-precorrin-6B (C15)-methyltransferase
MWDYVTYGIPDSYFERDEEIPMTKEEIRAIAISKARIRRGDKFLDIGCGTGSITIEAALLVGEKGKVFAIDKEIKAIELTRRNIEKFKVNDRVVIIHGSAPEILYKLQEKFDVVFIGGGSEVITEIIAAVKEIIKPKGRVVIDAILLETVNKAINALNNMKFNNIEVTEIIVAKGMKTRYGTAMVSRNPIFIISGEAP